MITTINSPSSGRVKETTLIQAVGHDFVSVKVQGKNTVRDWTLVPFAHNFLTIDAKKPRQETPKAVFVAKDDTSGVLKNLEPGMAYYNDSLGEWKDVTGQTEIPITPKYETSIYVIRKSTADKAASLPQEIPFSKKDYSPEWVTSEACHTGKSDGKIIKVNSKMEYAIKGSDQWNAISGNQVTGLVKGTYLVRFKAVGSTLASAAKEVIIDEAPLETPPSETPKDNQKPNPNGSIKPQQPKKPLPEKKPRVQKKPYLTLQARVAKKKIKFTWKCNTKVRGYVLYKSKTKNGKAKFFKRINGNKKRTFVMKYKGKKSRGYYKIRFFTVKKGKIVYGSYSKAVRVK